MPSKGRRSSLTGGRVSQSATLPEDPANSGLPPTDADLVLRVGTSSPPAAGPRPPLEEPPPQPTPEWARLYSEAAARHREERERIEQEQVQAQRLWEELLRQQGEQVPEGERSLEHNEQLHRQMKRLARSGVAAEYERENVIGDPHQTFGVEIEFDGANPHEVARALHQAGLAASPHRESYHWRNRQQGMWTVERDATVSGEVVSPVLHDTPETWAQLERVCTILRDHGARVSTRTGGHVHVGADSANLDHDVRRSPRGSGLRLGGGPHVPVGGRHRTSRPPAPWRRPRLQMVWADELG